MLRTVYSTPSIHDRERYQSRRCLPGVAPIAIPSRRPVMRGWDSFDEAAGGL
jgi:hypothetical protein